MSQLHKISGCENVDRKLDVVFMHGLGGDAFTTWRHGSDNSTSWPHWVGEEFRDIGVWTLEYAASPWKPMRVFGWLGLKSRNSGYAMALPDRARQVADQMRQKGLGQRPLIFVGHSLGGLLAKKVLHMSAQAGESQRIRVLAGATRGVLFLGTPHTGVSLATLGDLLSLVFGTTVAVETLREHDPHLRELYQWYLDHSPRLGIETATYYEERGFGGGAVTIVNPTSSHPGVGQPPVGLDEDHLTLAKPRSREAQVCDALRELIRNVLSDVAGPRRGASAVATPAAAPSVVVNVRVVSPVAATSANRIPRESPPRAEHFVGRAAERDRLTQRLRDRRNTAVVGPGGFGKTALAAEALHAIGDAELESLYPDGWLFLDLYQTRTNADAIWSRIADRLASPGFREQAAPRERAEQACSGKRLLIIIEGGEDADGHDGRAQLVDLLSVFSFETIRLLLTRNVTQASAVESISLRDALEPDDAAALFDVLNGSAVSGQPRRQLLDMLAGHPLALTWAGALIARSDEHPTQLIAEWTSAQLPALNDPSQQGHTLRWLYDRSVRSLDADACSALVAAGMLAHAPVPLALVASALNIPDAAGRARAALRRLSSINLMRIDAAWPEHWQFGHVLAHRYAREQGAENGNPGIAEALASALQTSLSAFTNSTFIPSSRRQITLALDHCSALLAAEPNAGEAISKLWKTTLHDLPRQFRTRGLTDLWRGSLAACNSRVGSLLARAPGQSAIPIQEYDLCVLHNAWGDLYVTQGQVAPARQQYNVALELAEHFAGNLQRDQSWRYMRANCHSKIGSLLGKFGDLSGSLDHHNLAHSLLTELVEEDSENPTWLRDLMMSHMRIGDVLIMQRDLPAAVTSRESSLRIARKLVDLNCERISWKVDLSICLERYGDLLSEQADFDGALSAHEERLQIMRVVTERDKENMMYQNGLILALEKLGDTLMETEQLEEADLYYNEALTTATRLAEHDPMNAQWRRGLAVLHQRRGDLYTHLQDLIGAQDLYKKALKIFEGLSEKDRHDTDLQRDVSVVLNRLAQVSLWLRQLPEALSLAEASFDIDKRLSALDPTNGKIRVDLDLAEALLAEIRKALNSDH